MPASNKLPLDTHETVHSKEADERDEYQATQVAYEKGHKSKSLHKKYTMAKLNLFNELFDKKLVANPKAKAKKLAKIVRESDKVKSRTYPSSLPSMYSGEVVPYTNMGMISKLLTNVLLGFQMKGKLNKVGNIFPSDLLKEPEVAMKLLSNLMNYIIKNAPGDDSYIVIDNQMKLFLPVVQSLTGKLISKH